jgi:hypothetical protein
VERQRDGWETDRQRYRERDWDWERQRDGEIKRQREIADNKNPEQSWVTQLVLNK